MSNYKRSSRKQPYDSFSFSHSKKNSKEIVREGGELTAAEERGLVGWISSLLQPFEKEFLHALECYKKRSIVDLSNYIISNYPHLKEIVSYFIIASLIDFGLCLWNDATSIVPKSSNDVFLDILIEQLAHRFFRESQWFTKIMHLPIHEIFALLDTFSKGYLSLYQLVRYYGQKIDLRAPSSIRTGRKLKCNLDGLQERIYQQNLREAQLRVDLTSFHNGQLQNNQECSFSYRKIKAVLNKWSQGVQDQRMKLEQLDNRQGRKKLEDLELSREDYRIRSISKSIVEGNKTPHKEKRNLQSVGQFKQNERKQLRSNFKPLSQTKTDQQARMALEDIHPSPSRTFITHNNIESLQIDQLQLQRSRRQAQIAIGLQAQAQAIRNQQQQRAILQHDKLLVKAAILSELQNIKFAKFHNRHRLCSYI